MGKRFVVEDSFWQVFPDVEIGVLCVDGIKPTDQIGEEEAKAAAKFLDRANASADTIPTRTCLSRATSRRRYARASRSCSAPDSRR